MTPIDIKAIKPGDTVTVETMVVERPRGFHDASLVLPEGVSLSMRGLRIVAHHPRALRVGDRIVVTRQFVGDEKDPEPWDLLYIDDSSFALVGRGRHTRAIKALSDLTRVSP